uniref:Uncharacterized protein n=1 Tax=Arundo donax TaxID=35708 RepID=A0A0A9EWX9_ARUDO
MAPAAEGSSTVGNIRSDRIGSEVQSGLGLGVFRWTGLGRWSGLSGPGLGRPVRPSREMCGLCHDCRWAQGSDHVSV